MPVQYVRGVGPARAEELARLGVRTVRDLLLHLPRRYEDRTVILPLAALHPGEPATVRATIKKVEKVRTPRRKMEIVRALLDDGTASAWAVWFNQPHLMKLLRPGLRVFLTGKVEREFGSLHLQSPEIEVLEEGEEETIHAGRIVPIYPLTGRLSQRQMRSIQRRVVEEWARAMPEVLPRKVRERLGLMPVSQAWRAIHFPSSLREQEEARRRLAFEELFLLQVAIALERRGLRQERGYAHLPDGPLLARFRQSLPFRLTSAQERVWREIARDMESPSPMHRLLQGDVGSGKTVVAALALLKAVESGGQGALMAPTEVLAGQHYLLFRRLLAPLGVEVALLSGISQGKEREALLFGLQAGAVKVAVGTHALIQEGVSFRRLSLVVIDEQHRFGVRQRTLLREKGKKGEVWPDTLVMTATPIPRTLTLTLFGDLDVSVIDELPPGRQPVRTHWLPERERPKAYGLLLREVRQGRQGYVVCPLIEESEAVDAQAVTSWAETLRERLPGVRLGVLHGRLSPQERERVMEAFREREMDVLVTTTVVEVGVDVPNATVMIIEGAERFGLAQLHQLRGRVGRGSEASYCLLISGSRSPETRQRLRTMVETQDGFRIAEVDLELRGPGEFFGTRQHGMPDFRVAHPVRDLRLLEQAREEAQRVVEEGLGEHPLLQREIARRFGEGVFAPRTG